MKLKYILIISVTVLAALMFLFTRDTINRSSEEHEELEDEDARAEFVIERYKYEYDMLKDPRTGVIPAGIFEKEIAFAKKLPVRLGGFVNGKLLTQNTYIPAGPNNIGGRTRAVAYDVRYNNTTNKVIIAGCVSGGIMRSADGGQTWTRVTPQNDIHNFTAIGQDPRPGFENTWYAGGGEALGNTASGVGAFYFSFGVWKSVDNGLTWTKLPLNTITDINGSTLAEGTLENFDHPFDIVHRIQVNPTNGDVYIAGHRRVLRSSNGGATFQVVFAANASANSSNGQTEVVIANTGRVFVAMNGGSPDVSSRGVWFSNTGSAGTFTRIAGGQTLGVDSVAGWRANDPGQNSKRILLALAPSNQNIGYVYYENGLSSTATPAQPEADLYKFEVVGNTVTWTNRSANMPDYPNGNLGNIDPLAIQGGYDMMVKVYPTDPNIVFIGGTNLYRSNDGFATPSNVSWINGYAGLSNAGQYPGGGCRPDDMCAGHPDIHDLVFNPLNPAEAICANDGGVQMTQNILAGTGTYQLTQVSWTKLPNYQTLQYYYVTLDPDANRNNFAGGAQDNGAMLREKIQLFTPLKDSNEHRMISTGDGASVGLSRVNTLSQAQFFYYGIQLGRARRISTETGTSLQIQPDKLTVNPNYPTEPGGEFVTVFKLDPDNTEDLYYVNFNRLFRTTSASSVAAGGWTELLGVSSAVNPANPSSGTNISIRSLAFTRGLYNANHTLFLGTTNGKIFRLNDPRNADANAAPTDITPPGLAGNVQDISVNPNNDNEVLAVVSNYNTVNIWWTNNAKATVPTWVNAEGNLTLPSIRSCAIVVKKEGTTPVTEYYVGTSVGLYSATSINGSSTVWQREGANVLNFAVIQSMAYRPVDNTLVLGTHGNGMYFANLGTPNFVPVGDTPVSTDTTFIRVFPTISSTKVHYEKGNITGIKKITIQLFDMAGRLAFKRESIYTSGDVPIHHLASGVYILNIFSDDNKYKHVQKIVRQ